MVCGMLEWEPWEPSGAVHLVAGTRQAIRPILRLVERVLQNQRQRQKLHGQ